MSPRALVTGAGGFIGTNLVTYLAGKGHDVVGFVRPGGSTWRLSGWPAGVEQRRVDLLDTAALDTAVRDLSPTWVFHLATVRDSERPREMVAFNVGTTVALLRACAAAGVERLVHAASSMEYGDAPTPYEEDKAVRPTTWYGALRAASTDLILDACRQGKLTTAVLRLFHVYGAWESPDRLIPQAVRAALNGASLALTPAGSAHDLVHVDDVVHALTAAADNPDVVGRATNVCTGVATDNLRVAELIGRAVGRKLDVRVGEFPPREWDRPDWVGRLGRIGALLQRPPVDAETGLAMASAWWRAQHDAGTTT